MINKRLIALMGNAKKFIGFHVFFQLINLALNITAIFLLADFLQKIYEKNISNADIIKVSFGIIIVIILRFISNILIAKMSYCASGKVKQTLREKIYSKLLNLGISYREKFSTSEVVQISMEGVDQLEVYFGRYLPQFFYSVISPIILFAVLSTISVKASLILILCVPLIPISIILIVKIAKKILKKYAESDERIKLYIQPKNLGYNKNFEFLLKKVSNELYMLSDQDDVWEKEKIEKSVAKLEKENLDLVFGDLEVVDENLKTIYKSFNKYMKIDRKMKQDPNFAQKFNKLVAEFNRTPGLQQQVMRIAQIQDERKRKIALQNLPENIKQSVAEMFRLLNS